MNGKKLKEKNSFRLKPLYAFIITIQKSFNLNYMQQKTSKKAADIENSILSMWHMTSSPSLCEVFFFCLFVCLFVYLLPKKERNSLGVTNKKKKNPNNIFANAKKYGVKFFKKLKLFGLLILTMYGHRNSVQSRQYSNKKHKLYVSWQIAIHF